MIATQSLVGEGKGESRRIYEVSPIQAKKIEKRFIVSKDDPGNPPQAG